MIASHFCIGKVCHSRGLKDEYCSYYVLGRLCNNADISQAYTLVIMNFIIMFVPCHSCTKIVIASHFCIGKVCHSRQLKDEYCSYYVLGRL